MNIEQFVFLSLTISTEFMRSDGMLQMLQLKTSIAKLVVLTKT